MRPKPSRALLLGGALIVTGLPAAVGAVGVPLGQLMLAPWLVPFVLVLLLQWYLRRREELGPGSVSMEAEELVVSSAERTTRVALADIRSGARAGASVSLGLESGHRLELELGDKNEAEELMQVTGTGVEKRTLTFDLRETIGPFVAGILFYLALVGPIAALTSWLGRALTSGSAQGSSPWPMLATVVLAPALTLPASIWLARARVPKVTIGQDGITLQRWYGDRFIPHSDITGVKSFASPPAAEVQTSGIRLKLGREQLVLSTVGWSDEDLERAVTRLREARKAFKQARKAAPRVDTAFVRRGRTVAEWRQQLLDSGFRTRVVTAPDAEAVLHDPTQPLEHRAGAAIALRALEPERGAERIRVAAEVAADPRARELLLATLEDDAVVEAALEELAAYAGER